MKRRQLLDAFAKAGVVTVCPSLLDGEEARVISGVTPVLEQALPNVTLDQWKLTALEVTYAPGEIDSAHRHPGFVFGYVIAGTLRFQVDGQKEVIYHAAECSTKRLAASIAFRAMRAPPIPADSSQ